MTGRAQWTDTRRLPFVADMGILITAGGDRRNEEQQRARSQADDDDQAGPSQNGRSYDRPNLTDDEVPVLFCDVVCAFLAMPRVER